MALGRAAERTVRRGCAVYGSVVSGWLLMALSAATGAYCLLRMRSTSRQARTAAGGEAVMGFGMAAMALPAAVVALPGWGWTVFAAVFAAGGLRALWQLRTGAHHLHHLVGSLAMVYMALTMGAGMPPGGAQGGPMAHMAHSSHMGSGVPLLTGALLVYYAVYVLRTGAALVPSPLRRPGESRRPAGPWPARRSPAPAAASPSGPVRS